MNEIALSRRLWQVTETVHTVVYFSPNSRSAYEGAGLKGYWMGYFASRAAALGSVPASVVEAAFFNFHPKMVRRAIPDAWSFSTPARVLEARYGIADAALRSAWEGIEGGRLSELADALERVVAAGSPGGRPLFAAHAGLPVPEPPHLRVWHACTAIREFRGDTHIAALVAEGIDGIEAHVTACAAGTASRAAIEPHRGWSPDDWDAAADRLRDRGLLDGSGELTATGRDARARVERATDVLSFRPWRALGAGVEPVLEGLVDPVERILAGGVIPFPNPMGLPRP